MSRRFVAALVLGSIAWTVGCSGDDTTPSAVDPCKGIFDRWSVGKILDTEGCGLLAQVDASQTPWGGPFYIVRLQGTHYEMGYQHGRLVGPRVIDLWWTYMQVIANEAGMGSPYALDGLLGGLLDAVWDDWYAPNTPQMFHDELQGFADGMAAAGVEYGSGPETLIKLPRRVITLIDLAMSSQLDAGDLGSIDQFIENGYTDALLAYYHVAPKDLRASLARMGRELGGMSRSPRAGHGPLLQCSYFAAWGDRTDDGGLYMTRNMDFTEDTGIGVNAAMVVYVPDQGSAYASISWLGAALGVLAGVSREGIAIGAVGSSSPYERLNTEPALLRAREALEKARNLDDAIPFFMNAVGDGITRAPTIGFNAIVSWGDPRQDGAGAQVIAVENNGLEAALFHHHTDCSVEESLIRYDLQGNATLWTHAQNPDVVNTEAEAKEIDASGKVRHFQADAQGNLVLDDNGDPIEVDSGGVPIQTGYPLPCAVYRGDEAMAYGVRVHQTAANGPADGGKGLMTRSGSWKRRYWPMYQMTKAYETGSAMQWDGAELIADHGGTPVKIGLNETELISRTAAMSSNVWDVVFDCTDLVIRVSFESGTGDTWKRAADQPGYYEIDLTKVFLTD
jgi:hypothetical protein